MSKIITVEEEFIENLRRNRKKLAEELLVVNLTESQLKVIDKIYKEKKYEQVCGKETNELLTELQRKASYIDKAVNNVDNYEKHQKKMLKELEQIKRQLFLSENVYIDSEVLKIKDNISKDVSYLLKMLKQPKQVKLLFRASQHGFSVKSFHIHCNSINDTLTLVRTEFGKTIAGYSPIKWNQGIGSYVGDPEKRPFLLQMDLYQKMVPVKDLNLIYCNSGYGPTFGDGHDLYLADNCHLNRSSYGNFPYAYQCEGSVQYERNQQSYQAFSGATEGYGFKVVQYEVYELKWS